MPYLFAISSALCLSCAWLVPGTMPSALLGFLAALGLVPLIYKENYRAAYLHGCLATAIGMHWVFNTVKDFGGFSTVPAFFVFLLFVFSHGLQTPLAVYIFKSLPKYLDKLSLRAALAWTVIEFLPIRIFPWQIGHTQLSFLGLSQIADIAGSLLVSFVLVATAEAITRLILLKERKVSSTFPLLLFVGALFYSSYQIEYFCTEKFPNIKIELTQANISTVEKGNQLFFESNFTRYKNLSSIQQSQSSNTLIIWPETVYTDWLPNSLGHSSRADLLPTMENHNALLFGALTYIDEKKYFNSALLIKPDGSIPKPYNKRILMPFGEYMPLANVFPWIKSLNPMTADFTSGSEQSVFGLDFKDDKNKDIQVKIASLICYEDVIASLAREATKNGANILVNLTNDAWFGKSLAPYQHNLIASFRAIENRRYLLRSTNSGLTAVIDETGKTIAQIPVFSENVLYSKAKIINYQTIYSKFLGNKLWLLLFIFSCLHVGIRRFSVNKSPR